MSVCGSENDRCSKMLHLFQERTRAENQSKKQVCKFKIKSVKYFFEFKRGDTKDKNLLFDPKRQKKAHLTGILFFPLYKHKLQLSFSSLHSRMKLLKWQLSDKCNAIVTQGVLSLLVLRVCIGQYSLYLGRYWSIYLVSRHYVVSSLSVIAWSRV